MVDEKYHIKISVRSLVEFILRSGDIDNRRTAPMDAQAMAEGSRIHRKIQGKMDAAYRAEVPLKLELEYEDFCLTLEGRADGIIEGEEGVIIDEIKGIYRDLEDLSEPIAVHKAQAMCYAYIYALEYRLDVIGVQMTYCNLETEDIRRFYQEHTFTELRIWFEQLIEEYLKWARFEVDSRRERNHSIHGMEFPYEYRKGQRDVAVSVYRSIQRSKRLFVQAPTGIGKTMSTIFPAVKSMGEQLTEKIFYLTARTTTRMVAEEALCILREKGLLFRHVSITAKEKICPQTECICNPDECPMAKGHFDRINDAVYDVLTHEWYIHQQVLEEYAEKHMVCPFELTLDVSSFVDGIICDYNYVFDPNVCLKRYFAQGVKGNYVFLIDEAHNLVDRAREMYSAVLHKEDFLSIRKIIVQVKGKSSALEKNLKKCNQIMLGYKRECENYLILDQVGELILPLMRIQEMLEKLLDDHKEFQGRDQVLDFYFSLRQFLSVHDRLDENYEIYTSYEEDGSFRIKLFCMNPSVNLREALDKGRASIFFSATLLPVNYYKDLLSGDLQDYAIYINSPFDPDKRLLVAARDVSSKYTRRNAQEYQKMFLYIQTIVHGRQGNYMAFFPSYRLMEAVYQYAQTVEDNYEYQMQSAGMGEKERRQFLEQFGQRRNIVAFCVLGGIFSEGIDLKYDSLIGSIIIGTGLPMVCDEREILRQHFDSRENIDGFDYAYRYAGMNKVLQAAGRVIRTSEDVGVIALLDERFQEMSVRKLFPAEWEDIRYVSLWEINGCIENFWKGIEGHEDN